MAPRATLQRGLAVRKVELHVNLEFTKEVSKITNGRPFPTAAGLS